MKRDYLFRHTLRFLLGPDRFLAPLSPDWDFPAWAEDEYEWSPDPLGGLLDHAQRPVDTIIEGSGDCVDFGAVAASWLRSRGEPVYLGVSFRGRVPIPRHLVVSDGKRLYEGTGRGDPNGRIWDSVGEYLDESRYDNVALWLVPESDR